ncbi:MAG: SDR family oxidoreductase [Mariprofundaceae bacterium]|nr:SDR family oxidoreductase [Mariprofundaceae bacterium]
MNLKGSRVILTGAAGGMGRLLAEALARRGARLALVDINADALQAVCDDIAAAGGEAHAIAADLSKLEGCDAVVGGAIQALGGIDMLINLAGLMSFRAFEDEPPSHLDTLIRVNLIAPMMLTREVLPHLISEGGGRIVNIGSIFGSIGFACFTSYSTSKFALRGFSEALRRELADTGIEVTYIAPRAVRTPMNTDAVMQMGEATKMNMDEPEAVVAKIVAAIEADKKDVYLGWPESFFVRLNALFPRLVDKALAAQNRIARKFAKGES